jgi:hypothetical protein
MRSYGSIHRKLTTFHPWIIVQKVSQFIRGRILPLDINLEKMLFKSGRHRRYVHILYQNTLCAKISLSLWKLQ